MEPRRPARIFGTAISAQGLLALMGGLGLLYGYFAFGWSSQIRGFGYRVLLLSSAILIALWGANEVLLSLMSSFRGRRDLRTRDAQDRPAQPVSQRFQLLVGVVMTAAGLVLSFLMVTRANIVATVFFGVIIGILLCSFGIRNVVLALWPPSTPVRITKRQALPLPGMIYLLMMSTFLVGSLIGRSNMLMLMFALMAGPFILNGWITYRMLKRTQVKRQIPRTVFAGEAFDVSLTVSNEKPMMSSWMLDVADRVRGNAEEIQTGVLFTRIPPRESRHGAYRLRLMQRGRYVFGPISVATRFPLGVAERGLIFDYPEEIIVFPRLGRLTAAWNRETLTATELVEKHSPRVGVYDDEFHRLREFRWGDNPRAIHWRTSARRNELMVREYHQSRDRDLTVLLDLWIPKKPTDADWERVETAVSFAATVCVSHMQESRDSVVTLSAGGKDYQRWQGQAGARSFDSLLETLALLSPGPSMTADELLERSAVARQASLRLLLITTRTQPRSNELKSDAAPMNGVAVGGFERFVASQEELSQYFEIGELAEQS